MAPKQRGNPASSSSQPPVGNWEDDELDWELDEATEEEVGFSDADSDWLTLENELIKEDAEEVLLDYLVERNRQGKLSAKDLCIIGFWCPIVYMHGRSKTSSDLRLSSGQELVLATAKTESLQSCVPVL